MRELGTDDRTIHLRDYWRVAYHGRWTALGITLVVAALVAVATLLQTPIYRATTELEIQPRAKSVSPTSDFSKLGTTSWGWMAEDRYLNTQMEIVRSSEIAAKALALSGAESHPRFLEMTADDAASVLAESVKLDLLVDTYVLTLSIEDADPRLAQTLANAVAEAYQNHNVDWARDNAQEVVEELREQLDGIKANIQRKENEKLGVMSSTESYVPGLQESHLEGRLKQLQQELTAVRIAKGQHEAFFEAVDRIRRTEGSYLELPVVATDTLITELVRTRTDLGQEQEKLALTYGSGHPEVMAVRAKLGEIQPKLDSLAAQIISNAETDRRMNLQREDDLERLVERLRQEGLNLSQTLVTLSTLDAEINENRRIHELIVSRIEEINLNIETQVNNVRVLQKAAVPTAPVRPRKILNLAAGLLLGLILGLGTVFFVDYLDNTIKSTKDIEQILNIPLLAIVPKYQKETASAVKEAFQTLRTSIMFASKGRSLKSLLVTSAGPGEGKSSTIVRLAQTLASAGDRVIIVDADLRRPTVHSHLNLRREGGLTNYLMNGEARGEWVRYLKDVPGFKTLKALTCGPIPPNPVELFGLEHFHELLEDMRKSFDWVLIDSPPLASLSDSVVLASMVDMAFMAIKHNENDRELILRCIQQLRKVNANIIGAVLNNVDLKHSTYRDYYYAAYKYVEANQDGELLEPEQLAPKALAGNKDTA